MQKEFIGKSLDEALGLASSEFGVETGELKYQKISESGIGPFKKVKILVSVPEKKEEIPEITEDKAEEVVDITETVVAFEDNKEEVVNIAEEIINVAAPRQDNFPKSDKPAEVIAREFVAKVLAGMNIKAEVSSDFDSEDETVYVNIEGPDMGVLIGKRGQTLDSLQYLTSLVVNRSSDCDYLKVKLDTENYRARRKDTLENLAKNIAGRVKRSRRPISLEPMNPYERRIIHSTLQNDRFVETHSEGEDPYRRVVITMRKDAPRDNRYGNRRGGGYGNRGGYGGNRGGRGGYGNRGGYGGKKKFYPRHNEQSDDYSQDYKADYAAYLEQKAAERAAAENNGNNGNGGSLF